MTDPMTDPMIWGTWPLVADLNHESVTTTGAVPDDPLQYQTLTGDGEDGLKRRAACDECRTQYIVEDSPIGADDVQENAS
jgi:hypothetical protein